MAQTTQIENLLADYRVQYAKNVYKIYDHMRSLAGVNYWYPRQLPMYDIEKQQADFSKPFLTYRQSGPVYQSFASTPIYHGDKEVLRYIEVSTIDGQEPMVTCFLYNHSNHSVRFLGGDPDAIELLLELPLEILSAEQRAKGKPEIF